MSVVEELAQVVRRAAESAGPSVVAVNRSGTGLVAATGLVVTNAHNLRGEEATLTFHDGREAAATVRGLDADGDLAVLAADTGSAPAVSWSEKDASLGQVVVGLASPRGRSLRATVGTVSSVDRSFRGPRGRRISGGFEHTAPLARGSSGGPVLDEQGAVLGLNTHRVDDGFYLAVPTGEAFRRRLEELAAGASPSRRRLGAAVAPPQAARHLRAAAGLPEVDGLLVRDVAEDTPASRAGLRRGDVLLEAGGRTLRSVDDLYAVLDGEGGTVSFRLVRATEELTVEVGFE